MEKFFLKRTLKLIIQVPLSKLFLPWGISIVVAVAFRHLLLLLLLFKLLGFFEICKTKEEKFEIKFPECFLQH
jgi:hypothetical protein